MIENLGERISVCLLTYNHAELIESTLRSILDQTVSGYEVIVSDDCSNDGTWERIQALAAEDERIRPVRTPRNMGMAGNANYAVAQSSRPYIALLHHDDLYRKDLLEKWADVLERHNDVSFVFNPYDVPNAEYHYGPQFEAEHLNGHYFLEKFLFARWGCPVRGTAMIRRSHWQKLGGMRERFNLLADVDLWMRLASVSSVGYVNEPVITPRHHRPEYYPDIYTGKAWHWSRLVFLYEIHATNRLEYFDLKTIIGRLRWWQFRWRLSLVTAKWLTYAVVRKKRSMIESSHQSKTDYDLWFLNLYRYALRKAIGLPTAPKQQ